MKAFAVLCLISLIQFASSNFMNVDDVLETVEECAEKHLFQEIGDWNCLMNLATSLLEQANSRMEPINSTMEQENSINSTNSNATKVDDNNDSALEQENSMNSTNSNSTKVEDNIDLQPIVDALNSCGWVFDDEALTCLTEGPHE